ncbi:Cyclopropane-fatty-acyl-phospholipid synthase [Seminavis robusta]|uniref:Cyclopropane-fatty-acyl-phospholipid synthase n=1 Tax=Seminavis robusta TaxID=568900 RepID=A0A9N8ER28_9STRA|nr:Cyclopropane-fatty-acyl-phospholipid synthase [Seminavis robusta]|eukprot:Sro1599_g284990.1 Cyclopropane-fatty-acyl-phospholipid synthase (732) ;mRNA; f:18487-20682
MCISYNVSGKQSVVLKTTTPCSSIHAVGPIAGALAVAVASRYYHVAKNLFEFPTFEEMKDVTSSTPMLGFTFSVTLLYAILLVISKDSIVNKLPWLPAAAKAIQPTYNSLQATFNVWHAAAVLFCALHSGYSFWGNTNPEWNPTMGMLYWLYFLNKIVDCADTVFIKLSDKKKSVSKLHWMHHMGQIWLAYFVLNICPMGDCWGPQFINSSIHAAMYSWYLMSASKIPALPHFAKMVKPCLTAMQMTQFLVLMVHNSQAIRLGTVPIELSVGSLAWMVFLFAMFGNFWVQAYTVENKNNGPWESGSEMITSGKVSAKKSWSLQFLWNDAKAMDIFCFRSAKDLMQWKQLFERRGLVAFGMGYAKKMWDVSETEKENLDDALYTVSRRMYGNLRALKKRIPYTTGMSWWLQCRKRGVKPAREVRDRAASDHYNLSSQVLWDAMLDQETKTYTCGMFAGTELDLGKAQQAKVDYYIDEIMKLKYKTPEERAGYSVLDVGSGWGSIVNRLATKYPEVSISALTHSPEQIKEYNPRVNAILADMVDHDYGENLYDCVIMIEVEHVGRNNYGHLLKKIRKSLKETGIYVMQSLNTPRTMPFFPDAFIDTYIFPGGYLPSVTLLSEAAETAGLKLIHTNEWDKVHYEITFELWRRRFDAKYPEIANAIGEEAARAFRIYLAFTQYTLEAGGFAPHTMIFNRRGQGGVSSYFPRGVPGVPPPGVPKEVLAKWLSSKRL